MPLPCGLEPRMRVLQSASCYCTPNPAQSFSVPSYRTVPSVLQVGLYKLHGPLVNVGYGRPDATGPDLFAGIGSNTNDQRDYPANELINEWGVLPGRQHAATWAPRLFIASRWVGCCC